MIASHGKDVKVLIILEAALLAMYLYLYVYTYIYI